MCAHVCACVQSVGATHLCELSAGGGAQALSRHRLRRPAAPQLRLCNAGTRRQREHERPADHSMFSSVGPKVGIIKAQVCHHLVPRYWSCHQIITCKLEKSVSNPSNLDLTMLLARVSRVAPRGALLRAAGGPRTMALGVKAGDQIPDLKLEQGFGNPGNFDLRSALGGKSSILISLPGAFTPT